MKVISRNFFTALAPSVGISIFLSAAVPAQETTFHKAPALAKEQKNPYAGQRTASEKSLYHLRCARCHGEDAEGSGNIPALATGKAQSASDGELF